MKVLLAGTDEIRFELSCAADPVLYDLPLTLSTRVPKNWSACVIRQGAATIRVSVNDGFIRYDALPGKEPVVIRPALKL